MAGNEFKINTRGGNISSQQANVKVEDFNTNVNLAKQDQNTVKKKSDISKALGLTLEVEEQKIVKESLETDAEIYELRKQEESIIEEENLRIKNLQKQEQSKLKSTAETSKLSKMVYDGIITKGEMISRLKNKGVEFDEYTYKNIQTDLTKIDDINKTEKEDKLKKNEIYGAVESGALTQEEALTEGEAQSVMLDQKILNDVIDKNNASKVLNQYSSKENINLIINEEKQKGTFVSAAQSIENYKNDLREQAKSSELSLSYKSTFMDKIDSIFVNNTREIVKQDNEVRKEQLTINAIQTFNDAFSNSKNKSNQSILNDIKEISDNNELFGMSKSENSEVLVSQVIEEANLSLNPSLLEDFKKYSNNGVFPYKLYQSQIDKAINGLNSKKIKTNTLQKFNVDKVFNESSNISKIMNEGKNQGKNQWKHLLSEYDKTLAENVEGHIPGNFKKDDLTKLYNSMESSIYQDISSTYSKKITNEDYDYNTIENEINFNDNIKQEKKESLLRRIDNDLQKSSFTNYENFINNEGKTEQDKINRQNEMKQSIDTIKKSKNLNVNKSIKKNINNVFRLDFNNVIDKDKFPDSEVDKSMSNIDYLSNLSINGINVYEDSAEKVRNEIAISISRGSEEPREKLKEILSYTNFTQEQFNDSKSDLNSKKQVIEKIREYSKSNNINYQDLYEKAVVLNIREGNNFNIEMLEDFTPNNIEINGVGFQSDGLGVNKDEMKKVSEVMIKKFESQGLDSGNILFIKDGKNLIVAKKQLDKDIFSPSEQLPSEFLGSIKPSEIYNKYINDLNDFERKTSEEKLSQRIEKEKEDKNKTFEFDLSTL